MTTRHSCVFATFVLCCLALLAVPSVASAQVSNGTPEARAEVARGEKALEAKQVDEAIAAYRHAVDLDPLFLLSLIHI